MGKFIKLLDDALGRYLKVSGYDLERDFQQILMAFLETYAYAYLRFKPTNEMFLRKFLSYRDDIRSELDSFRTTKGKTVSIGEIKSLVENYLKEVGHAGDSHTAWA
jgi:hypothetical protein